MSKELLEFQARFAKQIIEQVVPTPLWTAEKADKEGMYALAALNRPPFGSQVENAILPLSVGLDTYKFGILIAEMGTGKTQMSYSTAFLQVKDLKDARRRKILFLTAGGKHLPKMIKEAKSIYGEQCVVKTIVNKNSFEKTSKGEIIPEDVYDDVAPEGKFIVYVMSKDTAKMDLSEEPIFNYGDICPSCNKKILPKTHRRGKALNKKIKPYDCPSCNHSLVSKVSKNICQHAMVDGKPFVTKTFENFTFDKDGNGILDAQGNPVKTTVSENGLFPKRIAAQRTSGNRKTSVGNKFRRIRKNSKDKIFEVMIVDEVHEMQSGTSLQGRVYRDLVSVSNKTLIMTGTLSNGYPSSVFFILQAIMPQYFKKHGYEFKDVGKFVSHYGSRKFTRSRDTIEKKGSKTFIKVAELPKISDRIISLLAPFTVWLKMEDLNLKMPSYSEKAIISDMEDALLQRMNDFKRRSLDLLTKHNPKLVKAFAQRFMYLQNNPSFPFVYEFEGLAEEKNEETQEIKLVKKDFVVEYNPFDKDVLFKKEIDLQNEVLAQFKRNRKVMVYSIYNKAALVADRVKEVLEMIPDVNLRVKIMPDSISGERIEGWIEENSEECDVLIVSPLKVATGLDLVQFPTIIFYETGVNLRVAQQAARRSWRAVGQHFPVEVVFMAYNGIQAHILDIMAKKMRAAATIEGKKVQDGQIAAVFDDDADFTAALNSIADNLEQQFKPDFSSSNIEEGKLRPATKLEEEFEKILCEVKGECDVVSEIPSAPLIEEILKEEEAPVENEIIIDAESIPEESSEEIQETIVVEETPVESEEISIKVDESNGQMSFVF